MNQIYLEDCNLTKARNLNYGYVITSPPDFEEIDLNPEKDIGKYKVFLHSTLNFLQPYSGYCTIIISDRKYNGTIICKDDIVIRAMNDWNLKYHQIWIKSYKKNLYRFNYTHVMTFKYKKWTRPTIKHPFGDAILQENHPVGKYRDNFAIELVKPFIEAYTNAEVKGSVYDPFMGSGTTALACLETGRNYIGSEIKKEVFDLCNERINAWTQNNITKNGCSNTTPTLLKSEPEKNPVQTDLEDYLLQKTITENLQTPSLQIP